MKYNNTQKYTNKSSNPVRITTNKNPVNQSIKYDYQDFFVLIRLNTSLFSFLILPIFTNKNPALAEK